MNKFDKLIITYLSLMVLIMLVELIQLYLKTN